MKNIDESLKEPLNPIDSTIDKAIEDISSNGLQESINENNDDKDDNKDEHIIKDAKNERLGGKPPLKTILSLLLGPVLSQVTNALFGIVTTIWVSKAIGIDGVSSIATMNAFDGIGRAFGFFLAVAASTQISSLFGKGLSDEVGQLISDLLRMCLVFGAIVPAILLPILKPCARWFGAEEKIVQMGFDYMLPLASFSATTCIFVAVGGFLQGEGRTFLFGLMSVGSIVLNMLVLHPLFLLAFKMGINGASYATIISEILPSIIFLGLYYGKKFTVVPKFSQLFKKFGPHSLPSLKVGFSQLIAQLSICIPCVLVRKYVGMTINNEKIFTDAMAGLNSAYRINNLSIAVYMAVAQAFIPAASYAYAAKKYRRFLRLMIHSIWINFAWGCYTMVFTFSIPKQLAKILASGDGYLQWAEPMIRIINSLAPVAGIRMNSQSACQALQLGTRATILSFLNNFVSICLYTLLLYYTDKTDGKRIIWCYPLTYATSIVFSIIMLWKPLSNIIKLAKEEKEMEENKELENISET
ncbi:MatE family protein [Tritrichomonas foetus]|uniref:MatE family protein n=1 Tax=Tritrichomonas foetus TaxID=1144522 RepID=A0A1J4JN86_9EUKA|nr:MatE family protein [Tritrichomonas foetus]|eukprot:OHS99003.1 MatE family protein [Tritrichomonas foetus]